MEKNIRILVSATIYSLLIITLFGCNKENVQKLEQRNWQLVWSDEFDGSAGTSPDSTKWKFDIGNSGWAREFRSVCDTLHCRKPAPALRLKTVPRKLKTFLRPLPHEKIQEKAERPC